MNIEYKDIEIECADYGHKYTLQQFFDNDLPCNVYAYTIDKKYLSTLLCHPFFNFSVHVMHCSLWLHFQYANNERVIELDLDVNAMYFDLLDDYYLLNKKRKHITYFEKAVNEG